MICERAERRFDKLSGLDFGYRCGCRLSRCLLRRILVFEAVGPPDCRLLVDFLAGNLEMGFSLPRWGGFRRLPGVLVLWCCPSLGGVLVLLVCRRFGGLS